MHFDFAAILVLLAFVTGTIWVLDKLVLAPRRGAGANQPDGDRGVAIAAPAKPSKIPWYVDVSRSFFPVILAVLVLRSFVVEPFRIPSGSMEPTLYPGDFILVNKFSFGVRLPVLNAKIIDSGEPQRGDVAVFRYPEDPSVAFIKRIVGIPGDRLAYRNKRLFLNGEPVPTKKEGIINGYELRQEQLGGTDHSIQVNKNGHNMAWEYVVPPGHYFALGDNRDNSRDSRFWGPLPEENMIGKAFLIWMNLNCITLNGDCDRIGNSIH
jgi:signal peptidase I